MKKIKAYVAFIIAGTIIGFSSNLHAEIPGGMFPSFESPLAVEVVHYDPKKADPYASYTIPGSSFEYRDANLAVSSALSTFILGKTLSDMGRDSEYAKSVGNLGPRLPDLDKLLITRLQEELTKDTNPKLKIVSATEDRARFEISPRALLFSDKEGLVSVTFYLETKLLDKDGKRIWWNRYSYKEDEKKLLLGPDGWTGEGGILPAITERVINTMLDELLIDLKLSEDSTTKEIRFKNCAGGEDTPNILLRESTKYFVVKKDLGKIYGPTTFLYSKTACQLAEKR